MTNAWKKDVIVLDKMSYIHYLVQFWMGDIKVTRALINSGSEVNVMTPVYTK